MLVVKVSRIRPGQATPEPIVVSADQGLCKLVLRLLRERLQSEESREVGDESVSIDEKFRLDD